jgi:mRNA interferase MazF
MNKVNFGDIVLLNFPFTDGRKSKKRPAMILKDFDDGDIIVVRITSQFYETKFDFEIKRWEDAGLRLPSVIRLHKIATLEKSMIEIVMGNIEESLKARIKKLVPQLAQ